MEPDKTLEAESKKLDSYKRFRKIFSICVYFNATIFLGMAIYFFVMPLVSMIQAISDSGLKSNGIPKVAYTLHKSLSPRYEKWARERIVSKKATTLDMENISGTEWPMFGSVFYLWATESLQEFWEKNQTISSIAPNIYARGAIEQAAALIADKNNAAWVEKHWGKDYLHKENTFYRMLLIGGLTSHYKLLHDEKYLPIVRDQVETLSKELDASPAGWLDDYPNQCFPMDVLAAIGTIKRADAVLGTDHSEFIERARRGFSGKTVDEHTGMPTYEGDASTGAPGVVRGCSNAWGLIWAPYLYPDIAKKWMAGSQEDFWQSNRLAAGYREFPKSSKEGQWYFDVDSGPVVAGLGAAASAFGIGAARANGRFDHAFPISTELIVMSAPLPDGTLLLPKLLSNNSDAPHLGEASILFILTRMPAKNTTVIEGSHIPLLVYFVFVLYSFIALLMITGAVFSIRRWNKSAESRIPVPRIQLAFWLLCLAVAVFLVMLSNFYIAILCLLIAQFIPQTKKIKQLIESR